MSKEAEFRALLEKWVDLAERTEVEYPFVFDANRQMDFYQGVKETKKALSSPPPSQPTGAPV